MKQDNKWIGIGIECPYCGAPVYMDNNSKTQCDYCGRWLVSVSHNTPYTTKHEDRSRYSFCDTFNPIDSRIAQQTTSLNYIRRHLDSQAVCNFADAHQGYHSYETANPYLLVFNNRPASDVPKYDDIIKESFRTIGNAGCSTEEISSALCSAIKRSSYYTKIDEIHQDDMLRYTYHEDRVISDADKDCLEVNRSPIVSHLIVESKLNLFSKVCGAILATCSIIGTILMIISIMKGVLL